MLTGFINIKELNQIEGFPKIFLSGKTIEKYSNFKKRFFDYRKFN